MNDALKAILDDALEVKDAIRSKPATQPKGFSKRDWEALQAKIVMPKEPRFYVLYKYMPIPSGIPNLDFDEDQWWNGKKYFLSEEEAQSFISLVNNQ